MKYKGFEIKASYNKKSVIIYKDGLQYSGLCLGSYKAAKLIIDRHVGDVKIKGKEVFAKPKPEFVRSVGTYSNKGYLSLLNEEL